MERAAPDVTERIRRYSEQLQRDPKSLVFALLADALRDAGQIANARRVCEHGLRIQPAYTTGRIILAQILLQAGESSQAREQFKTAIREQPHNLVARIALARILLDAGEAGSAVEQLEHVLLLNPGNPVAEELLERARQETQASAAAGGAPPGVAPPGVAPAAGAVGAPTAAATLDGLLASLRATEGVVGVLLVGEDGLPVAGGLPASVPDIVMSALFAEIGNSAKKYVGGMKLGDFLSGTIDGTEGNMVLTPMDEFLLVVVTEPNAKLGLLNVEIERTRRGLASL